MTQQLEAKLLSIGGSKVVTMPDPHMEILLERGREFDRRGRKLLRGELHRCHNLTALYYSRHHSLGFGGVCEIVTGYALDSEGMWFQHSWCWDGVRVIEPNINPLRYFGVVLDSYESIMFVFNQVVAHLPGFTQSLGRARKAKVS